MRGSVSFRRLGIVVLLLSLLVPFSTMPLGAEDAEPDPPPDLVDTTDGETTSVDTAEATETNPTGNPLLANDADSDWIPDDVDNCPDLANTDQLNLDVDGIGDACDAPEPTFTPVPTTTTDPIDAVPPAEVSSGVSIQTAMSASEITAGSQVIFTVTLTNTTGTYQTARFEATLPVLDGVTWIPSVPGCYILGSTLSCVGIVLGPNATTSTQVVATTTGEIRCGTLTLAPVLTAPNHARSNAASVTVVCDAPTEEPTQEPTEDPTQEPTDEPTEEPTDEPLDAVTITKVADADVVPAGQAMGYTITVTNDIDDPQVIGLTDPLPTGPGLRWSEDSRFCAIPTIAGQPTLSCPSVVLFGGQSVTVQITSPTTEASCGTYTNTATVIAYGNVPISSEDATTEVVCETTLAVDVSPDDGEVEPGDELSSTMVVTNTGPVGANEVTLAAPLPGADTLGWSVSTTDFATCDIADGALTCDVATLPTGESRTVTVAGTLPSGSAGCNLGLRTTATADADNADPATDDGSFTVLCPALAITKTNASTLNGSTTVTDTVIPDDTIAFTITVANGDDAGTATGVEITDDLPGDDWLTWTVAPDDDCTIDTSDGATLSCDGITLAPGETYAVTVSAEAQTPPTCGMALDNTASLAGDWATDDITGSASASVRLNCVPTCLEEVETYLGQTLDPRAYTVVEEPNGFSGYDPAAAPYLFCGTDGRDFVDVTLQEDDIFWGGGGENTVTSMAGGMFIGGDGLDDISGDMTGGIFYGGAGGDFVIGNMSSGTFNGGDDEDLINGNMTGGTFNGGDGENTISGDTHGGEFNGGNNRDKIGGTLFGPGTFNGEGGPDTVQTMRGGTFDGGDGYDVVVDHAGGTLYDTEDPPSGPRP